MPEIGFGDLVKGLRGWARGQTVHEQAAVELLIWQEIWLRRPDFRDAAITQRAPGLVAIINWYEAREFIDRGYCGRGVSYQDKLPASSTEHRILNIAVSVGEDEFGLSHLGTVHRWHVAYALSQACGYRLESPVPEPGHNHPAMIPGDPATCSACARETPEARRARGGRRHRSGPEEGGSGG